MRVTPRRQQAIEFPARDTDHAIRPETVDQVLGIHLLDLFKQFRVSLEGDNTPVILDFIPGPERVSLLPPENLLLGSSHGGNTMAYPTNLGCLAVVQSPGIGDRVISPIIEMLGITVDGILVGRNVILPRAMAGLTGDTKFRQVGVHDHSTAVLEILDP